MKKIIMFFAAALTVVMFAACSGCSSDEKDIVLPKTSDFNELVLSIDKVVSEKYPTYKFYEAEARFNKVDSLAKIGLVEPSSIKIAYGCIEKGSTVIATVDSAFVLKLEVVDEPWCEDLYMTPYIPMNLTDAVGILKTEKELHVKADMPLCLRHQLYYKEPEPRYFIGTIFNCHTVNVYSAEVDQPLPKANEEWLKEHNLTEKIVAKFGEFVAKPVEEKE